MERLLAEQHRAIAAVEQSLQEFESIEENYKQLLERLENLPKKIRHDVTVPLNSVGFFRGELVHTNEITVLLSSEYLVQVSATKAAEIASRRIDECRQRQAKAREEIKHFEEWKNFTQRDIEEKTTAVDIKEDFDEVREAEWREEHAKRVREERTRERKAMRHAVDDASLLQRLEELEIQEELEKYGRKVENPPPTSDHRDALPIWESEDKGSSPPGDEDEPSTSGGPRSILKRTTSSGSLKSVRFDHHEDEEKPIDSDDNDEPDPESDEAEPDAFTGLIIERDVTGKVVQTVGGEPRKQSRFKASRR
ncbi:unconventional prefoldin RPB5 interactor [Galendromus occidentalis]|uniref:Unconventional prefoldin RPB5 interactor n=1 Tax=Galendromus occidentalis TaxID=34638 RepID=A0AAJ6QW58_9ACAR|nr:unconventional prefoldin RPB5 interactor [Galendromus occidentalis]